MNTRTSRPGAAIVAALLVTLGSIAMRSARAADEPPRRLIYSAYRNEATALDAFKGLRSAENKGVLKIESYAIVSKDAAGGVAVKDLRQPPTRGGAVVGAMVRVLGGTAPGVGATLGDATLYLTSKGVGMSKEAIDEVQASLQPGESAIIAVVDERWASTTEKVQLVNASRTMSQSLSVGGFTKEVAPARAPTAPNPNALPPPTVLPPVNYMR